MRRETLIDYSARIARAIALIENTEQGEAPPPLARLAEAAALSSFHFHRVFRLMTGETLGEACQRLRLARSLHSLADTGLSITQASAGSGYATSQGYSRALQQAVGANASELRTNPVTAAQAEAALRRGRSTGAPLSIEVVSLAPFQVLALRRQGPYENLDSGFDRLFEEVFSSLDADALQGIWGVPLDDRMSTESERTLFDCAIEVAGDQKPNGDVVSLTLGGIDALAMTHVGSYDAAHAAIDQLYRAAIEGQLELAAMPPLIRYHDQPEEKPEFELRSTLYLPLA